MAFMALSPPSVLNAHDIVPNLNEWKAYHLQLTRAIEQADELVDIEHITKESCMIIGEMFDQYVRPYHPLKIFDPSKVAIDSDYHYRYNHDGVDITYCRRNTWVLDDYDLFVDKLVIVDGKHHLQ